MKSRVLITCVQLQQTIEPYYKVFEKNNIEIEMPKVVQRLSEKELLEIIDRFDGVIAGDDEFTASVIKKGKRLKVISKWGIGVDGIDLEAAKKSNIRVLNTPHLLADEVADVVVGYIILLARQLHKLDQMVRQGDWSGIRGRSLKAKTLGVVGLGDIGTAVVQRAMVMGMSVVGTDVLSPSGSGSEEGRPRIVELDELLRTSDFISLNCNLTASNVHMLDQREFALMKKGVYLINTARGPLISEAALVHALLEGKVAGVALDVFEQEPLSIDSPLRQFDNCLFAPHNSSNTIEAVMRVNELAIQHLLDGLRSSLS